MSTKKPSAVALNALATAIWSHVTITDVAVEAMRAAGAETDEVKNTVLNVYMARRMNPTAKAFTPKMLTDAAAVLALPGASSKADAKRTADQERFYTGARQYLFALRKKAEVSASDNRGGANNTGARTPRTTEGEAEGAASPAHTYETEADVRRHLAHIATTALAFIDKHAEITGLQTRNVVMAFVKATQKWVPADKK